MPLKGGLLRRSELRVGDLGCRQTIGQGMLGVGGGCFYGIYENHP